jgi:hypothetical protein
VPNEDCHVRVRRQQLERGADLRAGLEQPCRGTHRGEVPVDDRGPRLAVLALRPLLEVLSEFSGPKRTGTLAGPSPMNPGV